MVLPTPWANVVYALTALVVIVLTAYAWRRARAPLDRVALLGLGISLATPHLYIYDLLIVIPAVVCSAEHLLGPRQTGSSELRIVTYGSFLCPLLALGGLTYSLPLVTPAVSALWLVLLVTLRNGSEPGVTTTR